MKYMKMMLIAIMAAGTGGALLLYGANGAKPAAVSPKDLLEQGSDLLYPPEGKVRDYAQARALFEQVAAQEEDPLAAAHANQYLAEIYDEGLGVDQDENQAGIYYERARTLYEQVAARAEEDPTSAAKANSELGDIYDDGLGVDQDENQAHIYYERARTLYEQVAARAEEDPKSAAEANVELGDMYRFGLLGDSDCDRARTYYERAANQHTFPKEAIAACYGIASMYLSDEELGLNYDQSTYYFNRVIELAQAAGMPERAIDAHLNIGSMYQYGNGVPQNFAQARAEYEKISDVPRAQLGLAELYYIGQEGVLPRDYSRARAYFEQVIANHAASDWEKRSARRDLGQLYYYGQEGIVPRDYAEARTYFEQMVADATAEDWEKSSAIRYLGEIYYYGQEGILPRDYAKACTYYEQVVADVTATDWDKATAKAHLGQMYYRGKGSAQNYTQARIYLQQALEGDFLLGRERVLAELSLAQMYYHGHGVGVDHDRALQYFDQIAANVFATPEEITLAVRFRDLIVNIPMSIRSLDTGPRGRRVQEESSRPSSPLSMSSESMGSAASEVSAEAEMPERESVPVSSQEMLTRGENYFKGEHGVQKDYQAATRYFESVAKQQDFPDLAATAKRLLAELKEQEIADIVALKKEIKAHRATRALTDAEQQELDSLRARQRVLERECSRASGHGRCTIQ